MAVSAAEYYEVRWRVKGSDEAWSTPQRVSPMDEIVVTNLDRDQDYEFEVRAVSNCGAKSVWVPSDYTVPGAVPPTSIDTLTAQSLADGVHLGWTSVDIPAAGVEASIERSANGTTGWAERARVRSTAYTDPEPSGTIYYYRVRYVNFAGQFGDYSPVASSAGVNVGDIGTNASAAAADAAAALAQADAANAALAKIASDNILSAGEKPVVIRDNNVILTEQAGIDAQASSYGITTEKTAYDGKVSALTSYLATLTSPKLWSDLTGDTTIVGSTFRQAFADVYTTRQALLNAIYAAAKSKADTAKAAADAAQTTANTAAGNVPAVINGQFRDGTNGWVFDNPTGFYREAAGNSPDSASATYLVRQGQAGGATTYARNLGYVSVVPGQTITVTACLKSLSANAGAYAGCRISWRDAAHEEVGTSLASITVGPGGTYLQAVSKAIGQAPPTAQFAHFELYYVAHSSGFITATSCGLTVQPAGLAEVPDSASRFASVHNPTTQATIQANAAAAYAPSQNMIRNPTGAVGNLHWTEVFSVGATPEADITGYRWRGLASGTHGRVNEPITVGAAVAMILSGEMYTGGITGGTPAAMRIQFRDSGGNGIGTDASVTAPANTGWTRYFLPVTTPAGTVAIKVYFMASPTGGGVPFWRNFKLEFGNVATPYSDNATQDGNQLTNPGSGQRIGDQRNLLTRTVANFQTNVPAVPSFSIPTGSTSPVSVSISVPAWTLNGGSYTVNYSASSTSISLVRGIPSNVYFFMDDPDQTGGAKTLVASTNPDDAYANDGRIYIGAKKITVPSSGSSSGSGGGGGTGRPPNDPV